MFKGTLLVAAIFVSISSYAKPSDIGLCETYLTKNEALCCTQQNYLIQFGYKYCVKYVKLENTYQPATQRVLEKIRSCLVTQVINDTQLTCANSEERAMEHHLQCYQRAGFCGLPFVEKAKIFKAAWTEARRESFRETMIAVKAQCDRQN